LSLDRRGCARQQVRRRRRQWLRLVEQRDQSQALGKRITTRVTATRVLEREHALWIICSKCGQERSAIGNVRAHEPPPKCHALKTTVARFILAGLINLPPFRQKIRSNYRDCYRLRRVPQRRLTYCWLRRYRSQ